MSKQHLRKDKTCLNCGSHVEERFCSKCGQENTETRHSFGYLVRHFLEDITHYEGSFWRTLKYLLFRPAYLALAYLAGKRASYLPPVRLYIFASFIAFTVPYLLPEVSNDFKYPMEKENPNSEIHVTSGIGMGNGHLFFAASLYKAVGKYDSVQSMLPASERETGFGRWTSRKEIELSKVDPDELDKKFKESFTHNFPKALFAYLPLFALVLWLFHNKKKFLYFDHAIFTLYYFSFLLLTFTTLNVLMSVFATPHFFDSESNSKLFEFILFTSFLVYAIFYFFRGNRKMYRESLIVSFIKSTISLSINITLFVTLIVCLALITVFNLHS